MYKCMNCGEVREDFIPKPEYRYGYYKSCPDCGGEVIEDENECCVCKKALFSGEPAYEAGGHVFCIGCVSEVLI